MNMLSPFSVAWVTPLVGKLLILKLILESGIVSFVVFIVDVDVYDVGVVDDDLVLDSIDLHNIPLCDNSVNVINNLI